MSKRLDNIKKLAEELLELVNDSGLSMAENILSSGLLFVTTLKTTLSVDMMPTKDRLMTEAMIEFMDKYIASGMRVSAVLEKVEEEDHD